MTRQIVLDTETTGLSPQEGHRIIEVGCLEMVNRRLTGKHFHRYINPEREIDKGAEAVHGITNEFLSDKPLFKDIADEFIEFVADAELIIHNAPYNSRSFPLQRRITPQPPGPGLPRQAPSVKTSTIVFSFMMSHLCCGLMQAFITANSGFYCPFA